MLSLMTLYKFILLPEEDKARELWDCGEFFLYRLETPQTVLLYKLHDFYVEVYYSEETNQIVRFNPFCSKERLKLYFTLQPN